MFTKASEQAKELGKVLQRHETSNGRSVQIAEHVDAHDITRNHFEGRPGTRLLKKSRSLTVCICRSSTLIYTVSDSGGSNTLGSRVAHFGGILESRRDQCNEDETVICGEQRRIMNAVEGKITDVTVPGIR
jgi:hypothetical protein